MSYKYSFADNKAYGAEDLNAITKRLVTSGVEDSFADGVAYNVSKFNEAGKLLYTSGVVPESNPTLKVIASEDGKILINPGMAFFEDGSVIEIEDGGEEMAYTQGAYNYVYLKNDLINTNSSYPYCGVNAPEGDYVLLAEIDANGVITDKRTYAKGKLPGYQSVAGNVMRIQESIRVTGSGRTLNGSATFDIGENNFEYILAMRTGELSIKNRNYLGVYNIAANSYIGFRNRSDDINLMATSSLYVYSSNSGGNTYRKVTFSLENGILTVNMSATRYYDYDEGTYIFPIDLILF